MPLLQLAVTWGPYILVQCIVVCIMFFLTIFKDDESSFLWLAGMLYYQQMHSVHVEFLLMKSTTTP